MFDSMPPWMRWAMAEIGVKETPGRDKSTPRILAYRKMAKIPLTGDDGDVPWCAIFANASLEMNGKRGTRNGLARSFMDRPMQRMKGPALGCFVVLSRGRNKSLGHVGIYRGETDTLVYLVDGNANDSVGVHAYPKDKVLGYFWPGGGPIPPAAHVKIKAGARL